jgi:16S rRNA processing protein RimM
VIPDEPEEGSGEGRVAVGRITRAHGVHGEVAVLVLTEVVERFAPGSLVRLEDGRTLTVEEARPDRGRLLVRFLEVPDRGAAQALASRYVFVPASEVPDLPDGSFWPHELVGCEVVTEDGRPLGAITEVMHTPGNDVWAAVRDDHETLIPALREVVVDVDLVSRLITVRPLPGLISSP